MTLLLVIVLGFLVTAALLIGAFYFIIEVPAARKALRARFEAIQEVAVLPSIDSETVLLRQEVLSRVPALNQFLFEIPLVARLNLRMQQAGVRITPGLLLGINVLSACFTILISLLAGITPFLHGILVAGVVSIPYLIIAIKRERRFSQFEEQFPDAIDLLARAVRAGHAFTTGLELIAGEMAEPVAGEFRRTYEQQNLGLPMREALDNLFVRIPLPDVHVFITALVIQRETGGNLAEILDKLSLVIRERFKLVRQIRVFTAQGRMSLYVLSAIPVLILVAMYFVNRPYVMVLFTDSLGQRLLAAGVILQTMGYLVIRKIIQPKS